MKLARMIPERERKDLLAAPLCVRECEHCGFKTDESGVRLVCDCPCHHRDRE